MIKITKVMIVMVWLVFFEKNVILRTLGVRANTSKRISPFSVAKGLNAAMFLTVGGFPNKNNLVTFSTSFLT